VFGSSESQTAMIPGLERYCGVAPKDLVYVAEYCGGGFGSKGTPYPQMSIPAVAQDRPTRDDAREAA
jgi:xanthine dehydrogenase molybdenum-binding subunit